MMEEPPLTQLQVRELFDYCPHSGRLTWLVKPRANVNIGDKAGWYGQYGKEVGIGEKSYKVHKVIWLWMTGYWPKGNPTEVIDHWNRNPYDNRWSNLRLTTQSQNVKNSNLSSLNTTGYRGVAPYGHYGRFKAYIHTVDSNGKKKQKHLGTFATAEEAYAARLAAED